MTARRKLLKTAMSSNNVRDQLVRGERDSPLSQSSSSQSALSIERHKIRTWSATPSPSYSINEPHGTQSLYQSASGQSLDILQSQLPQLSQLLASLAAETTGQSVSTSASTSPSVTSLPSISTTSSTWDPSMSMPIYAESSNSSGQMTTEVMQMSTTMYSNSSKIVMVITTTITTPVPSLTATVISSPPSHVNLAGTLAPTLGLLALLAIAAGAIIVRRRKRSRKAQRVSRGIEGGLNKNNNSGMLPLMEEIKQTYPHAEMMAAPRSFNSSTELLAQYGTQDTDYEEPDSGGAISDSVALLSEGATFPRQAPSPAVCQDDTRNLQTSHADDESISVISSVEVPFFEHIKAARRAGLLPPSISRLQLESQPPAEDILNPQKTNDI